MNHRKVCLFLAAVLTASSFAGCSASNSENTANKPTASAVTEADDTAGSDLVSFRPVDCGVQAQDVYEYPFLGLTAVFPQALLDQINCRDVFVSTKEDYADADTISYALLRFFAPTQAQKEEEGMSVDLFAWEESLEKVGALGVYQKSQAEHLDALTGCNTHQKIGETEDGSYVYYLSTNSAGNAEFIAELEDIDVSFSEMHQLDLTYGYNAFSIDRIDGIANVGTFQTQDVFGKSYTQDVFADYDLTLVNVFATWCSPCVAEIPELEKLRQSFADKGIKLGVVAVVLDTKTSSGDTDETAVEQAKILSERSSAQFPFLIPDEGNMNGRLTGIEVVPESFFVDRNGQIVSDPYIGANSLDGWTQIVERELANLEDTH